MQKEFDDFKYMLDAFYPLFYLTTSEYDRVIQKIRNIGYRKGYEFHTWNIVDGLQTHEKHESKNRKKTTKNHVSHENTGNIEALCQFLLKGNQEKIEDPEIFLLEDAHKYFHDEKFIIQLRKITNDFKIYRKHLILLSPFYKLPIEIEKYVTVINVPLPDRDDLNKRFKFVADDTNVHEDLKKKLLDAAAGLTDVEADLAFRLAKVKTGLDKEDAIKVIVREKEQIIKKSGILDYYHVKEGLDNSVGGLNSLKSWLKLRSKAFERKAKVFGLKEPKGILLLGVPGTGKSLTAKSISQEWKQPLLKLDIGKVIQAEVGSSENNIRMAIATAEAVAPCILWIDEIEKGLSVGGGEKDGGTNSRVFSTILTWMQEKTKPVFVVATANNISDLPPELLRKGRFDEIFFVDLPTRKEREKIFKIHLKKYGQDEKIKDYTAVLDHTIYFSGAEIEETVKEAMFKAYIENNDNPEVNLYHLTESAKSIVPLATTMSNKISGLREWAKTRARLASSEANTEKIEVEKSEKDSRTQRERDDDIF